MVVTDLTDKLRDINIQIATCDQNYKVTRQKLMERAEKLEQALLICNDHAEKVQAVLEALR